MSDYKICTIDLPGLAKHEAGLISRVLAMKDEFSGEDLRGIRDNVADAGQFLKNPDSVALDLVVWFPAWDARRKKEKIRVYVGANVEIAKRKATYSMAIGVSAGDHCRVKNTLQKMHWDYDFGVRGAATGELKPSPHVQTGGRLGDKFESFGHTLVVEKSIDKPRVPSMPTCFVLALHWAFLEYAHCDHVAKVLRKRTWNEIVRTADDLLLDSYFERSHKFLRDSKGHSFLTQCYS